MKQLVCDFCDSVRIGVKVGYKQFKKSFQECRKVRKYTKANSFKTDMFEPQVNKKVQEVRELAQKNYREQI
jgi:hypothetical protein